MPPMGASSKSTKMPGATTGMPAPQLCWRNHSSASRAATAPWRRHRPISRRRSPARRPISSGPRVVPMVRNFPWRCGYGDWPTRITICLRTMRCRGRRLSRWYEISLRASNKKWRRWRQKASCRPLSMPSPTYSSSSVSMDAITAIIVRAPTCLRCPLRHCWAGWYPTFFHPMRQAWLWKRCTKRMKNPFRWDAEGHCIYINSRIWEMTGMPPDDIYTRGWEQAIHPDDRAAVVAQWYGCIAKRQTFNMEYRYQRPNGAVRWVVGQAMAEWNNQGEMIGYVGTITDITDTKNMQEELCLSFIAREQAHTELKLTHDQLLQSEKMASIGQLAAGVAHEINNPVGYIASNIGSLKHYLSDLFRLLDAQEMAVAKLPIEDSLRQLAEQFRSRVELPLLRKDIFELMGECKEGIGRVKKIEQSLKDFSRVSQDEWLRVDIHEILEKALNIVCNELKYKAEVVREYGELPTVECLPVQLSQVFMNLLLNGAQAFAERGTIIIRTGRDGGERVWGEIEDCGAGIAAEHLTRIFEPFFTTKPIGKGTGLGLSVAYNIIQAHGGRITVDSRQGAGSRFKVVIPASRKAPA